MSQAVDLSIIIPAYMEATTIADSLQQLAEFLKERDYGQVEVLVVTANSPDGTAAIAASQAHLFREFRVVNAGPRAGKGRDVRLGIFEARGRYRVFMDADLATPLRHLDDVAAAMERGDDVIIAVRNLISIHKGFFRKFMSSFGNLLTQVIVIPGIRDTQCGFKAFSAPAAEAIFSRQTMLGWSFDAEVLLIARRLGYRITTIPAPDWSDPKEAAMGLVGDAPLKASFNTFRDLFIIRWNALSGRYRQPSYRHR